jgi:glycosyltransferase involved in cell wall biosynthesis
MRGNAQLVLVGDGLLVERIRAQRIPGVHLLGYLHGIELATAYASSDVFAFPSSTETFGNVLLEAMASGTAPVCVNAGGPSDFGVHGVNALMAAPNDAAAFTEQLARAIAEPALRRHIGDGARQTALARRWDAIYDHLLDDYAETIADRGQRRAAA